MCPPVSVCNCIRSLCSLWKNFSVIPGTKFAIIWELLIIAVILVVAWIYSYEVSMCIILNQHDIVITKSYKFRLDSVGTK